jgi:hypothetical protein
MEELLEYLKTINKIDNKLDLKRWFFFKDCDA